MKLSFFGLLSIIIVLLFQNCGPGFRSNSVDTNSSSNSSQRFLSAKSILDNRCAKCHNSNGPGKNFDFSNEADYVLNGLIVPGNVDTSPLIFRLKNYESGTANNNNMPTDGTRLSDQEYALLVDWVKQYGQEDEIQCDPNEHLLKPQIKRLTLTQFRNSVVSTFGSHFSDGNFPQVQDGNPRLGFANDPNFLNINEVNINGFYDSANAIASVALAQVTDLRNCANGTGEACINNAIQKYGSLLWRRPLTSNETNDLQSASSQLNSASLSRSDRLEALIKALILSSNHLYRTEVGAGAAPQQGIFSLTHYEIASLLSFTIWNHPPDATLYSLAENNRLHNVSELQSQVTRMLQDSKAQGTMTEFIVDLLKMKDVTSTVKDNSFNLTNAERNDLLRSAETGLNNLYSSADTDFMSAFSQQNFYINSNTARFFNYTGGTNSTLSSTSLPANQRHGILSHPAFLTSISGQISSGIVRRGVYTLEQLLCHHIPPPPADAMATTDLPPDFDPNVLSTRQVLQMTHSGQASCIGCHSSIDPAGFAYENFNAIGQFRTVEKNNINIDSSGTIVGVGSEVISFNSGIEFFQNLELNARFNQCISKKFFKYVSGQTAQDGAGRCEFQNYTNNSSNKPQTVRTKFESLVGLESFIKRKSEE